MAKFIIEIGAKSAVTWEIDAVSGDVQAGCRIAKESLLPEVQCGLNCIRRIGAFQLIHKCTVKVSVLPISKGCISAHELAENDNAPSASIRLSWNETCLQS